MPVSAAHRTMWFWGRSHRSARGNQLWLLHRGESCRSHDDHAQMRGEWLNIRSRRFCWCRRPGPAANWWLRRFSAKLHSEARTDLESRAHSPTIEIVIWFPRLIANDRWQCCESSSFASDHDRRNRKLKLLSPLLRKRREFAVRPMKPFGWWNRRGLAAVDLSCTRKASRYFVLW